MKDVLRQYISRVEQSIAKYANEEITESSARAMVSMLDAWHKMKCMLDEMR